MSTTYTLDQAVKIARKIEFAIRPVKHHCALGGSCLHVGTSCKDVDIVIHPRNERGVVLNPAAVLKALAAVGFKVTRESDPSYGDQRLVVIGQLEESRVDLFFFS